jgi:ribose 1,5-bisphosphokinase PhnN
MKSKQTADAPKKPVKRTTVKKATKVAPKPVKAAPKASGAVYTMPVEVKEWIEKANSTINHLKGKVERLEDENAKLKAWKIWAENRILQSSKEEQR